MAKALDLWRNKRCLSPAVDECDDELSCGFVKSYRIHRYHTQPAKRLRLHRTTRSNKTYLPAIINNDYH